MMMLKSVCLVYIVVFASLGGADVTEENIDGYDVVNTKTSNTDNVVIKKDGTTLTVQIKNTDQNYTVFKVNKTCIVAFGSKGLKECTQGTIPAHESVPEDIKTVCGDNKEVLYMTDKDCPDENRRLKRAVHCFYYHLPIMICCPSSIRIIRVRVCRFSG